LVEIADNSQSILNSGYLPTLTGLAGTNYNVEDINANLQDGEERIVDGAKTNRYNASLNLNYTLFDGLGRWYNFKQLKEQYNLTKLERGKPLKIRSCNCLLFILRWQGLQKMWKFWKKPWKHQGKGSPGPNISLNLDRPTD
jgi:hypothetical protein